MNASRSHRIKRIGLLVLGGLTVEACLFLLVTLGPAMAGLVRPGYVIVAVAFAAAIWHAATRRRGQERRDVEPDRRNGDRRHPATDSSQS